MPYSGNICPDGHCDIHQGAWPADMYYGDTVGDESNAVWSDLEDYTTYGPARMSNVPGDGKFDQGDLSSSFVMELQVCMSCLFVCYCSDVWLRWGELI